MTHNSPINIFEVFQQFQNHSIFKITGNTCTPHPPRPTDERCCYCKDDESGLREDFEKQSKIKDVLIQCGHGSTNGKQCSYKMHLSCATFAKPILNHSTQYLSLRQNNGTIWCPDHYCEICFGDRYQASASCGELVHDIDTLRAFHKQCMPVGAKILKDSMIKLAKRSETKFSGQHAKFCGLCGEIDDEKLYDCNSCVQSFHPKCHQTKSAHHNRKTTCRDCMFDVQYRLNDKVFVMDKDILRVATCLEQPKTGIAKTGTVYVYIEGKRRPSYVELNRIFKPIQGTVEDVFKSWKMLYNDQDHLPAVSAFLQELYDFWPSITRTKPDIINGYCLHDSFKKLLKKNKQDVPNPVPRKTEINKLMEIRHCGRKGNGVVALQDIPPNTYLGTYYGEITTVKEKARRMKLGEMSLDKEAKFYTFESKVLFAGSEGAKKRKLEEDIIIDASSVQNETAIFNSSCSPNCEAQIVEEQMGDFEIAAVRIYTGNDEIKAGTELTINYQWENTVCYCSDKCKKPPVPIDLCSQC